MHRIVKSWCNRTNSNKGKIVVNKDIFSTRTDKKTETTNAAGGPAYNFSAKHALAQIASTNCFNGTYYTNARANLEIAKNVVEALKEESGIGAIVAERLLSGNYDLSDLEEQEGFGKNITWRNMHANRHFRKTLKKY